MDMKHLRLAALFAAILTVIACDKRDSQKEDNSGGQEVIVPSIILSDREVNIPETGGRFSIEVRSNVAVSVSIPADAGWISRDDAESVSSSIYSFSVEANSSYDPRSTRISFVSAENGVSETLTVIQKKLGALILSSNRIDVDAEGGDRSFVIKSNLDYKLEVEESAASWIGINGTKALSDDTIILTIAPSREKEARSARISITAEDKSDCLTVYQTGYLPQLVLSDRTASLAAEGGSITVEVNPEVTVEMSIPAGAGWLHQSDARLTSRASFTIVADANTSYESRGATVTFTSRDYDVSETVTIVQAARVLDVRTTVFDEKAIVLSLGAISDTHVDGPDTTPANKFGNALRQLKAHAAMHDQSGIDGIMVVGDLIDNGYSGQYAQISYFKNIYESVFDPEDVPLVYCIGNHDSNGQWSSNVVTEARNFRNTLGYKYYETDVDKESGEELESRDCVIHGYHVLTMTPVSRGPVNYAPAALEWLDKRLGELTAAEPDKYVLIITHPMVQNTVYGSCLVNAGQMASDDTPSFWYTRQLTPILEKYPQAVVFGGHLHFPLNDPRSIWQGDFTSLGCASTRYMAFEGGEHYVEKAGATTLRDKDEFSQGLLVQMDASGNIRFTRMDFYNNATIDQPWEISYPDASGKTHLDRYSTPARKSANTAPVIGRLEASIAETGAANVPCALRWSAAEDDQFAHHYEVEVTGESGRVAYLWKMSDYYAHPRKSDMDREVVYGLGALPAGNYSATVKAVDPWGAEGSISADFTVESHSPDPSVLPEPYVDIDFNGSVTDAKGKVSITNHGATVEEVDVDFAGASYNLPALSAGSGKYVACKFNELTSSAAMQVFAQNGFTVEAFYVNRKQTAAVRGIVCSTESGGWGLAERANGTPYFIVGEGSANTYKNADATKPAPTVELTHLVGVYDAANRTMRIYVNGKQDNSTAVSGLFHCGEGDSYNRFCLGADVKKSSSEVDFPAEDILIVDARIYSTALSGEQVTLAYDRALQSIAHRKIKTVSILAIGNSFSVDAMEYLHPMLKEAGCYDRVILGNLYIGGCSLETHAGNLANNSAAYTYYHNNTGSWTSTESYKAMDAIKSRKWDYISIQQVSGKSGLPATYNPYLGQIVTAVKKNCPGARLLWHMTWAYQSNSTHPDFYQYDNDQKAMYNAIVNAVKTKVLPTSEFSMVIPSGTAVQNLRTSFLGDNLTRDGYHMSYDKGRVLTAMMWAKQITGCDVSDIKTFPAAYIYSDNDKAAMREAVDNAYSRPFEVTESTLSGPKARPNEALRKVLGDAGYDPGRYDELLYAYTAHAFYNSTSDTPSALFTSAGNSSQFTATGIMTKSDLPVGTILVLKGGYQYRPEGWKTLSTKNASSERPANIKSQIVVIDSAWWGSWNYRAFNLAKDGNPSLSADELSSLHECFAIFVPKNGDQNDITAPGYNEK